MQWGSEGNKMVDNNIIGSSAILVSTCMLMERLEATPVSMSRKSLAGRNRARVYRKLGWKDQEKVWSSGCAACFGTDSAETGL